MHPRSVQPRIIACASLLMLAGPVLAAEAAHVATLAHFPADGIGDMAKFNALLKKAMAVDAKLGCGCTTRLWGRGLGGDGGITLVSEFSSLTAFAQYTARRDASPEWAAFIAEVSASGLKPPSVALVEDITP